MLLYLSYSGSARKKPKKTKHFMECVLVAVLIGLVVLVVKDRMRIAELERRVVLFTMLLNKHSALLNKVNAEGIRVQ